MSVEYVPKLSLIIANRNGDQFLENCLNSIFKEEGNFEVILIDDHSDDNSKQVLAKFIQKYRNLKCYFLNKHYGAAFARNFGVQKTKNEYLFFLDNDTILGPGWYKEALHFFKVSQAAAAQIKIINHGNGKIESAGVFINAFGNLTDLIHLYPETKFNSNFPIFAGKSAGLLFRRSVFEQINGFDRDYIVFLEDTDICWRVWLAGYRVVYWPYVTIQHLYGTIAKSFNYYRQLQVYYLGCRNTLMTLFKNIGWQRGIYLIPLQYGIWITLAILFLLKFQLRQAVDIIRGILWNLFHLPLLLQKRKSVQKCRQFDDKTLFSKVGAPFNFSYYIGKAKAYVVKNKY